MPPPLSTSPAGEDLSGRAAHLANPILPGYYADPSVLQAGGKAYIFATTDPWGGEALGCWESSDWKGWTYRVLNWPTKQACTSPTSEDGMVWAPSVLQRPDGKFHMVVTVGNEIWAGVADHPLGPWRNALGDQPLIPGNFLPGFHMIDGELFLDDDGQPYLYWGSGVDWVDGRCWAAKLKPDMTTFEGQVRDVTPPNYFEAPFMLKHDGRYYLMYSAGKTTEMTYQVHYAVGDGPFGPFHEPAGSPILATDREKNVLSPGHHAVFSKDGEFYIIYHRHSIPFDPAFLGRQICVDRLLFTADGRLEKVIPTHVGPPLVQGRASGGLLAGASATASSQANPDTSPACVLDGNHATRWAAATDARGAWLQVDLGAKKHFTRQEIHPEYAWKPYRFAVEVSQDATHWETIADFTEHPCSGSPLVLEESASARYIRLTFPADVRGGDISLFSWAIS